MRKFLGLVIACFAVVLLAVPADAGLFRKCRGVRGTCGTSVRAASNAPRQVGQCANGKCAIPKSVPKEAKK